MNATKYHSPQDQKPTGEGPQKPSASATQPDEKHATSDTEGKPGPSTMNDRPGGDKEERNPAQTEVMKHLHGKPTRTEVDPVNLRDPSIYPFDPLGLPVSDLDPFGLPVSDFDEAPKLPYLPVGNADFESPDAHDRVCEEKK